MFIYVVCMYVSYVYINKCAPSAASLVREATYTMA